MTLRFELSSSGDEPNSSDKSSDFLVVCDIWSQQKTDMKNRFAKVESNESSALDPSTLLTARTMTDDEANHYKNLSPQELEKVRTTFDNLGLENTKLTPQNISNVTRNLIEALRSEDWNDREDASHALKGMGSAALPALVDTYLTSKDQEQYRRVNNLIPNEYLGKLDGLLESSKKNLRKGDKELVDGRSRKLEREIDEVKKIAREDALRKARAASNPLIPGIGGVTPVPGTKPAGVP